MDAITSEVVDDSDSDPSDGETARPSTGGHKFQNIGDADVDLTELAARVAEKLKELREKYKDDLVQNTHFYVRLLQGRWTQINHGVPANGAVCLPRRHATAWARARWGKELQGFSFGAHSVQSALKLASGWAHKCEFFFGQQLVGASTAGYVEEMS